MGAMGANLAGRLTTGILIILVGVFLLLWTTGLLAIGVVWQLVPLLFVALAAWALLSSGFRNLVGPVMVILIAGAVFLRLVGVIPEGALARWWPLAIVAFGVLVMVSRSRRRRFAAVGNAGLPVRSGEVTAIAIFGSDDRRISSDRITGAEVLALFGDARIDFRETTAATVPILVDVVSVFGDAEIRVPEDWAVRVETLNIFGETVDRRGDVAGGESETAQNGPAVIVTGVALFGSIEIRD